MRTNRTRHLIGMVIGIVCVLGLFAAAANATPGPSSLPLPAQATLERAPTADAWISSQFTTNNFGDSISLPAGRDGDWGTRRSLLWFDLSELPPDTLPLSATLELALWWGEGDPYV
ncbi:MAG: DNRLRE domain-containing protein, partial [Anaerolineae bacterium]|nr:DNRLRE domain-containing protein [Anaerolineae bacterium]